MAEIDLTPTEEMAANAARGLELRRKHGKGGTEIGVARARDISNRKNLSPETVRRMHAFFSRHEKNKAGGEDDAGYIAWLLWGGDSGQSWAKRKVEQMDKGENQRSDTYKEIAQRLGSAAKMQKEYVLWGIPKGKTSALDEQVLSTQAKTPAQMDAIKKRAAADGWHSFRVQILDLSKPYKGFGFSRPGAKAKMAYGVADAAPKFTKGETVADAVHPNRKGKVVEVIPGSYDAKSYTKAENQYIVSFMPKGGLVRYGEQRLVRASRPGAKAKMARDLKVRKGNFTDAVAIVGQNGGGSASFYAGLILRHKDGEEQVLWMKHGYSTEKAAERAALQRFDAHVSRMSRPGAKATFAENVTYSVAVHIGDQPAGERSTKSLDEAKAYAKAMLQTAKANAKGKPVVVDVYPVVNYEPKPAVLTLRASRPGAKVANSVREGEKVSASDTAVSRKIRKLMDEGKPQKQAVAIALDLERRGEL